MKLYSNLRFNRVGLLLLFALSSCDYFYRYEYTVTNNTTSVATVKTDYTAEFTRQSGTDSVHIIKPGETKLIYTEQGGICGRNYLPENRYRRGDTILPLRKLEIYHSDTLLSATLRKSNYWSYQRDNYLGTYDLYLTDDNIKKP